MIWTRKTKDPHRWRKRFALFPKRIGERRVWLEYYFWQRANYKRRYLLQNGYRAFSVKRTGHDGYYWCWRKPKDRDYLYKTVQEAVTDPVHTAVRDKIYDIMGDTMDRVR